MNDPDNAGDRSDPPTADDDARLGERLNALGEQLAARRVEPDRPARRTLAADRQGQTLALRLATEFVAGILVGGAIGWFFDGWLGTSPWGLIVFLLLGFAAGVLNALRTAGVVRESPAQLKASGEGEKVTGGEE